LLSAQQEVDKITAQIEKATITAPFDGVITVLDVKQGDTYKGGELALLQDDSGYKVSATVDQYDISDIYEGMKVTIKTDTTGDELMDGILTFVSPVPKATTASSSTNESAGASASTDYPIEVTITNPSDRLRIGMTAKLTIIQQEVTDALTVSESSVQIDDNGQPYVEVVTGTDADGNQTTQNISVSYGLKTDYYVQIIGDGISEGMEVKMPDLMTDTGSYEDTGDFTEGMY
jgi:multidrug efflux pump subunit AcrA (membrane-fusion protein)